LFKTALTIVFEIFLDFVDINLALLSLIQGNLLGFCNLASFYYIGLCSEFVNKFVLLLFLLF